MSQAQFTIPLITVIPGQLITAVLWNNEFLNLQTNLNPSGIGGYSDTDTQMQIQTAPYPGSVTSHASNTAGELERVRYQIAAIIGNTYWYQAPAASISTLNSVVLPLGAVIDYHSATPPNSNFLLANGQAIGRSAYASLNTLYSTALYPFGSGDGATTFNLPNYQDRISIGVNSIVASAGAVAGSQNHTLLAAELPASGLTVTITDPGHTHSITDPTHTHTITDPTHTHVISMGTGGAGTRVTSGTGPQANTFNTNAASTGITGANAGSTGITGANSNTTGISASTSNMGSGTAHSILNPVIGMYKMIRVL